MINKRNVRKGFKINVEVFVEGLRDQQITAPCGPKR